MFYLTVAVVILTVLVVIDLALTGAVVRRLRQIEAPATPPGPVARAGADVSRKVGSTAPVLVAFLSTNCDGCIASAPVLAARTPELRERGLTVVPVLLEEAPDVHGLLPVLEQAGPVVVQGDMHDWFAAFGITAVPAYVLVDEGRIAAADLSIDDCLSTASGVR
jgi:hypothetical protein